MKDVDFYDVLTRAFSSDAIESLFSYKRMMSSLQDATDARVAQHALKSILVCGVIETATIASVSQNCIFLNKVKQIQKTEPTTSCNNNIDFYLSANVIKKKNENFEQTQTTGTTIESAFIAFLANYIVRTIQEIVTC